MAITTMGFTPIETAVEVLHAVGDEGVGTKLTAAQEPAFAHPFIPLDVKPRPIAAGAAGGTILEGFQCTLATGEGGVGTAHHRLIGGGLLMALEGIEEHRAGDARICRASVRLKLQQRLDDRRERFIETFDGRSGLSGEGITQTWKGKASRQSAIEEHTDRPQIGPFIDGHRTFDAFRCHVLGRPQSTLRQGAVQVGTGDETEVGEKGPWVSIFEELSDFLNNFMMAFQQHVCRFDIPVYQTLAVQMLQRFQKFESALEEPRPSVFGETLRVGDDDIFEGEGAVHQSKGGVADGDFGPVPSVAEGVEHLEHVAGIFETGGRDEGVIVSKIVAGGHQCPVEGGEGPTHFAAPKGHGGGNFGFHQAVILRLCSQAQHEEGEKKKASHGSVSKIEPQRLHKVALSSTMGPGVRVEPSSLV